MIYLIKKRIESDCILFSIGGIGYALLEIIWRHKTHWTMAVTGGACFVELYRFYKKHINMSCIKRCIAGSAIITSMEFICGLIVNVKYKLNVWDYSNCTLNIKGQICPFYSTMWALLCIPISFLCKTICKKSKHKIV